MAALICIASCNWIPLRRAVTLPPCASREVAHMPH